MKYWTVRTYHLTSCATHFALWAPVFIKDEIFSMQLLAFNVSYCLVLLQKEITDVKSASLNILRRLLPVPRKETFVIACEQNPGNGGFQVLSWTLIPESWLKNNVIAKIQAIILCIKISDRFKTENYTLGYHRRIENKRSALSSMVRNLQNRTEGDHLWNTTPITSLPWSRLL